VIDKRVQYTIESLYATRKSNFADYPAVPDALDLVEKDDKITFEMSLDDEIDKEEMLDIFQFDPDYEKNEQTWVEIRKVSFLIIKSSNSGSSSSSSSIGCCCCCCC